MTQTFEVALPLLPEAEAEARRLGHGYVGPEHLLLAIARRPGPAGQMFFAHHDLSIDSVRTRIVKVLGPSSEELAASTPLRLALRTQVAIGVSIGC